MNLLKPEALIICDASPLILLAKIDQLPILKALAEELWIPVRVWNEIMIDVEFHPEIQKIKSLFSHAIREPDILLERAFQLEVDPGEAAALALAAGHPEACLLIDDRAGRAIAQRQGIHIIGTLGILIRAKRMGFIKKLKPLFEDLKYQGWFISETLIAQALAAVHES